MMRLISGVLAAVAMAAVFLATPGCASTADGGAERARIRVELVYFGVDANAARGSQQLRWVRAQTSETPDESLLTPEAPGRLLEEARTRLATTPGIQFLQNASVQVESGGRGTVGFLGASGTRFDMPVRATMTEEGRIRVDAAANFMQERTDQEGMWRNVRFRPPWLRYGNAPVVVDPGGSGAARLMKTAGTLERPAAMDVYVFVTATVLD